VSELEPSARQAARLARHEVAPTEIAGSGERLNAGADSARPAGYADTEKIYGWSDLEAVLVRHKVTLVSLALIVGSLIWKGLFLTHYYFREDDFQVLDVAVKTKLTWSYLTHVDSGHFFPGVYALAWILSRVALYNWTAAAGLGLVMIAGASLAAWRLLRTLLGNRPAILVPLTIFVLSPIAFPFYSWWIQLVEIVPVEIAIFMALTAHIHYIWTGRFRHALAAAGWLFFGLIFYEKAAVIPILLYAVTAGFLIRQRLASALWTTLTQAWRAWLLYLVLLGSYVGLLAASLHTSKAQLGAPTSAAAVGTFVWRSLRESMLPGALGGPWHWSPINNGTDAIAAPPSVLATAALVITAAIVVASIITRPRAWRAWAILAGWMALADVVPIVIGRLQYANGVAAILAVEPRYVADSVAILAIVIALVFWPVVTPDGQAPAAPDQHQRQFFAGPWKAVAVGVVGIFVVGSVWSVRSLQQVTPRGSLARGYISTARAALAEAPPGTVIYGSQQVPNTIMIGLFGEYSETAVVLGPLSHRGGQVSWTTRPSGTLDELKVFSQTGQLYPASVSGTTSDVVSLKRSCTWSASGEQTRQFPTMPGPFSVVLQVAYLAGRPAAGQQLTVIYGNVVHRVTIESGLHNAYVPIVGGAPGVTLQASSGAAICIGPVVAGDIVPSGGQPIPATPQPG
jgi:hypothetical protein